MVYSLIEHQMESVVQSLVNDNARRIVKVINKLAAKQGGASAIENYQLLGKRVLTVVGVAAVAVQVVSYIVARKSEEQRIERVVRRVLEEERQKEEAQG